MAFLPLDKKFHPDFAVPNVAPSQLPKTNKGISWKPDNLYLSNNVKDLVAGSTIPLPNLKGTVGGQGAYFSGATAFQTYPGFTAVEVAAASATKFSIVIVCVPDAPTGNDIIYHSDHADNAFDSGVVIWADNTGSFTGNSNCWSIQIGNVRHETAAQTVVAGRVNVLVVDWEVGRSGDELRVWSDGKYSSGFEATAPTSTGGTSVDARIGGANTLNDFAGTLLMLATHRGAINNDALAVEISRDPFRTLLEPVTQTGYFTAEATGANTLAADSGTYSYTGTAAAIISARLLTADSGSYAYTGTSVDLNHGRTLTADSGGYTYTGTAAGLIADRLLTAASGSYAYTGTSAGLIADRLLTADSGSYAYTGTAATLTFSSAGNFILTADSGAYTYSGTNAGLIADRLLTADSGSYTYSGTAANLAFGYSLTAASGAYTYSGTAVGFVKQSVLGADSGGYVYNGTNASLTFTPVPADIPVAGGATVSGQFGTGATLSSSFGTGANVRGSL